SHMPVGERRTLAAPVIASASFVIALLPFVVLSFYNHPQNDDWLIAVHSRLSGFVGASVFWYMGWGGRYVAYVVLSASPLVYGWIGAYRWLPALVIALLVVAAYAATSALAPGSDRWSRLVVAAGVVALFLAGMPDLCQGVYWWPGAVCYQLGSALLLFLIALVLSLPRRRTRSAHAGALVVAGVLVVAAAGTNELILAYTITFLAAVLAVRSRRARRVDGALLLLVAVGAAAGTFALLAPGNQARL